MGIGSWERCGMAFLFPLPATAMYLYTHSDIHTYPCSRKFFFPDYRTPESSLPQTERQCLLTAQIWRINILYKAPVLSHKLRRQGQRDWILTGDLLFVWNPTYSATLLGPGSGRGSVGMIWWVTSRSQPTGVRREWFSRDRVVSLTVSVGSASTPLGNAWVQHSKWAIFTDRGQEGSTVWGEHQPSDTLGVHSWAEGTACTLCAHKGGSPFSSPKIKTLLRWRCQGWEVGR